MKKAFLLLIFCSNFSAFGQWTLTGGGQSLHVDQWDRVIQTFNLANTWNNDDIAPLQWGWSAGGGYAFLLLKKPQLFAVPQLRYCHWSTSNSANHIALHQLAIGAEFRFNPGALLFGVESAGPLGPRWYIGLQPGLQAWMPMLARNNEWLLYDNETTYRPVSLSFDLKVSTGFHAFTVANWVVTPELNAQWIRNAELYDWTEQILGQNIIGLNNQASNGINVGASIILTKIRKSTNWWDRPRGT